MILTMLVHAAPSTLSVSRLRPPFRAANGGLLNTNRGRHLTASLRTDIASRSLVTLRRRTRSLSIVVSSETSFSLGKDVHPSLVPDLDIKDENALSKGGHYVNAVGEKLGVDNIFVEESRGSRGNQEDFQRGGYTTECVGAHPLPEEQEKKIGDEFPRQHPEKDGRQFESWSPGTEDEDEQAGDGGGGNPQEVDFRTLVSAMGLILGTAVGPGILGLPAATLPAGILASTVMIIGAWTYVTASILLVAEISCAVMAERGDKEVSFTGLVEHTLGYNGARVVALVYASLNYTLLVACVAGLGSILHGLVPMPAGLWSAVSAAVVGGLVAFAPFKILDGFNRTLCALMLTAISSLVAIGMCAGKELVTSSAFSASSAFASVLSAVPLTVLTLGFHVITPVVCKVMKGRPQEARKAILLGGSVPLAMVLAWNGVVLSLAGADRSCLLDPIKLLLSLNRSAAPAVQAFALAALGTTLIGYAVSFPKQLADTAQIFSRAPQEVENKKLQDGDGEKAFVEIRPLLWALCPPTLAAVLWPTAFAMALDFAGVYANCFLFGILPPVMAWTYRYNQNKEACASSKKHQHLVPGEHLLLIVLFGISVFLGINPRK